MKRLLTHSLITVTVNVIAIIGILLIDPPGNVASPDSLQQKTSNQSARHNRLINEFSPYLLQHAANPIDWYPRGTEAFEKAKREDKPIFQRRLWTISTKTNAIILTGKKLATSDGKTAHGLLRGAARFNIIGVIDTACSGRDAGSVLDSVSRDTPVYATIQDFADRSTDKAAYAIIGVALHGGLLPADWKSIVLSAIENGMGIVNGLHQPLNEDPELQAAAARNGVELIDIRKTRPPEQLRFWNGEIYRVKAPIIAVLGLDCAIGKRTTARLIVDMCRDNGIRTEMRFAEYRR